MLCPYCEHQNLDGLDNCEQCGQDLGDLDVPVATGGLQKHLMEDTVGQIAFDRLVTVSPSDSVAQAVASIKADGIGQALVVEAGKLVGILTERDLLNKVAGRDLDLRLVPVSEVMTRQPDAVQEGDPIRVVVNKMAVGEYRHVPIVKGDQPVGLISATTVANHILKYSALDF